MVRQFQLFVVIIHFYFSLSLALCFSVFLSFKSDILNLIQTKIGSDFVWKFRLKALTINSISFSQLLIFNSSSFAFEFVFPAFTFSSFKILHILPHTGFCMQINFGRYSIRRYEFILHKILLYILSTSSYLYYGTECFWWWQMTFACKTETILLCEYVFTE